MGRSDIVTVKGGPVTLVGNKIKVGMEAPVFKVLDADLEEVSLDVFDGKTKLIASVPSLDTPVCDLQIKRFNDEAASVGKDIVILFISMDLPFAQDRWCTLSKVDSFYMLSDHRDASFGEAYGVLIKDIRLLSRAVFIADEDNILKYVEYCDEIYSHVDYTSSLEAASRLAENTQ